MAPQTLDNILRIEVQFISAVILFEKNKKKLYNDRVSYCLRGDDNAGS